MPLARGSRLSVVRAASALLGLLLAALALPGLPGGEPLHAQGGFVQPHPRIQALLDSIRTEVVHADLDTLVGFFTRHTSSDTLSPAVGIGAARRWIHGKFAAFGQASGGALEPAYFDFTATICGRFGLHRNVLATLPGTTDPDRIYIVSGHMDDRTVGGCDATSFAPGANDDGSGTAGAIELARALSRERFDATLIFMTVTGEDEGLFGSTAYAQDARAQGLDIDGMITLDVVGNIVGDNGITDSTSVRHFSVDPHYSSSRQMARIDKAVVEAYLPGFTVTLIPSQDRPGRGGDHIPFNDVGYTAVRFTEPNEDLDNQHSPTDIVANMSPSYNARVARAAAALLANLANAPRAPEQPRLRDGGDGTSLLAEWDRTNTEGDFAGYLLGIRRPSDVPDVESTYERVIDVGDTTAARVGGLEEGQVYWISVAALDTAGFVSHFSLEASLVPRVVPAAPQGLDATSRRSGVDLLWRAGWELDLELYRVYRATAPETTFAAIAEVVAPETTFSDTTPVEQIIYLYRVAAVDTAAQEGPASSVVRGRLATHDAGILIVDGTRDGAGGPFAPTDAQVDDYYERLIEGFPVAGEWDLSDSARAPTDADLAIYSTVLWHQDDRLGPRIADHAVALEKYVFSGARLLLSGWGLMASASGQPGPEFTFARGEFVYDVFSVTAARASSAADRDFAGALSLAPGTYPDLGVDSAKAPLFGGHLFTMDVLTPIPLGPGGQYASPRYTYVSSRGDSSEFHGEVDGLVSIYDPRPVSVLFDFPLYYMQEAEARAALRQALIELSEQPVGVAGESPAHSLPRALSLGPAYPNPFASGTAIPLAIPPPAGTDLSPASAGEARVPVRLRLYDIRGHLVGTLLDGPMTPGRIALSWDGRTERGGLAPSGVYFARLESGGRVLTTKVVVAR